jgi:hypothetical protein
MQKNSEIRSISLVSIKTRSCLYPILPFEFGIAESAILILTNNPKNNKICQRSFKVFRDRYSPLRIQDVQAWVRTEDHSAPTVTQLLAQSAVLYIFLNKKVSKLPYGDLLMLNKWFCKINYSLDSPRSFIVQGSLCVNNFVEVLSCFAI